MTFERPNIQKMRGYSYGEQPGDDKVIKLNTNENPYPASPEVAQALQNFDVNILKRYPEALANEFRSVAANLHQLTPDHIIATKGGDELLRLLFTTFTDPGDVVAMTDPTYSLYPVLAEIQDVQTRQIPLTESYSLVDDFAEQANTAGAKMTFVVNPHAPSGHLITAHEIESLAERLNSLLLVDEAYVDFINPEHQYNCLKLAEKRDNVIFLRSMSKGYGLAGLRFGYGIGHPSIIEPMLTKTRDSYNLDAISQKLATAALKDQDYAKGCWQKVRDTRAKLTAELTLRGFTVPSSEANFVLAKEPSEGIAKILYELLRDQGILVRYFPVPGLSDKLRISVGTEEENASLLANLDKILEQNLENGQV